jgi:hypothetical protein
MTEIYCVMANVGGTRNRCVNCNRVIRSPHPPERLFFVCRSEDAQRARAKMRAKSVAAADPATVARAMVQAIASRNQRTGRARPIRSEAMVVLLLEAYCAKKALPCVYFTGDQCGHPQARCSNLACAEVACPLGHFDAEA